MAAERKKYQVVGRYVCGNNTVGYQLTDLASGASSKYTKDQMLYLVGRGQIVNCSGQLYKDKVILRGEGVQLDQLPVVQVAPKAGADVEVRTGAGAAASAVNAGAKPNIKAAISSGRYVIGYVLSGPNGTTRNVTRDQLVKYAKAGQLGNARCQESNGKVIIRGVGINLNTIPTVTAESLGIKVPGAPPAAAQPAAKPAASSPATGPAPNPPRKEELGVYKKQEIQLFKSDCLLKLDRYNYKKALVRQGFSETDFGLQRFDCTVRGNKAAGIFVELAEDARSIAFSVTLPGEEDPISMNFRLTETDAAWKWAINQLLKAGAIK